MDKSECVVGATKNKHNYRIKDIREQLAHTLATSKKWSLSGDLYVGASENSKTQPMCTERHGCKV
jgi:hypothetical protein